MKRKVIGYLGLVRNSKKEGWFINCQYPTMAHFRDWDTSFHKRRGRKTKIVPVYEPKEV